MTMRHCQIATSVSTRAPISSGRKDSISRGSANRCREAMTGSPVVVTETVEPVVGGGRAHRMSPPGPVGTGAPPADSGGADVHDHTAPVVRHPGQGGGGV